VSGFKRAIIIVADGVGCGGAPDAAAYGDAGADTLGNLARAVGGLALPHLQALGLGNLTAIAGVREAAAPRAAWGVMREASAGKDTITGHWEMAGLVTTQAMATFPNGFPREITAPLRQAAGRGLLGNKAASGTAIIDELGAQHVATGDLILYTSADSVLQLAAHEDRVPEAELHAACEAAREVMRGEHAVGRVIARPFTGAPGAFTRTGGRRDFSLEPPRRSYLVEMQAAGVPVHAVGKIRDLFAGVGIDRKHAATTNADGLAATTALLRELEAGLVFTNLVETDQIYGHRHDTAGFARSLEAIDAAVAGWLDELLGPEDLLILTADHGVDPTAPHTDHPREYAPLIAVFDGAGGRHDGPLADVGASTLDWLTGRGVPDLPGTSFI
jgi:phosphopentomutase